MFTGIIIDVGYVSAIEKQTAFCMLEITHQLKSKLYLGQSIACNGVCLTITTLNEAASCFWVDLSEETLNCSNFRHVTIGTKLNLECALSLADRLDGHYVLGHIDGVGYIEHIGKQHDVWQLTIKAPLSMYPFLAKKGSVAINGVSLTINEVKRLDGVEGDVVIDLTLIPHTFQHTNFSGARAGDKVNIEFDPLARYVYHALKTLNG